MSSDHVQHRGVANDLVRRETTNPSDNVIAELSGRPLLPNTGIPLDLDWVRDARINTSAVERRAQSHVARRTVKKEWQAAWLLRAISCMDLTTLSGDDTDERVRRLCAKARHPVRQDLVEKLGIEELGITVAAVCVYHTFVEIALHALEGSNSCGRRIHGIPGRAFAAGGAGCRNSPVGGGGGARD
jgi:deoxyribose-phosphate aldolase